MRIHWEILLVFFFALLLWIIGSGPLWGGEDYIGICLLSAFIGYELLFLVVNKTLADKKFLFLHETNALLQDFLLNLILGIFLYLALTKYFLITIYIVYWLLGKCRII